MEKTNIKIGTETENKILDILQKHKFWAYLTALKANGQPVDIIAMKSNLNMLLDAKHVRKEEISFSFDRVEPNQHMSMLYAKKQIGIKNLGFAIYFERLDQVLWLDFDKFLEYRLKRSSINAKYLPTFEEYLNTLERSDYDTKI